MEDIIAIVPKANSSGHFYLEYYWTYDDGTFSVCDTDGDHTSCKESDVPTGAKYEHLWRSYFTHVARTGCDCVHEFMNQRSPRDVTWQVRFLPSILGVRVLARRRARGQWLPATHLPKTVQDFLCIVPFNDKPGASLVVNPREFANVAALREKADCLKWQRSRYAQATFILKEPPREMSVRELKARAREQLRKDA